MHFAFIPYGKRSEVELLLRDMEAQKHVLKMTRGEEVKSIYLQGQVRTLPLGVYEYIFPKEDLDIVLNSLILTNEENRYLLNKMIFSFIKKFYKLSNIPEYKKDKNFLWIKDHVNIIPLGIREDVNVVGNAEIDNGFAHEAL